MPVSTANNKHYAGYLWVITRDALAEEHLEDRNETGTTGPHNLGINTMVQRPVKGEHFRMYDDDGILYYEGIIMGKYDGFEPLRDFGTPNAGAVRIDYYSPVNDTWTTL
jgi:hypothetical protein